MADGRPECGNESDAAVSVKGRNGCQGEHQCQHKYKCKDFFPGRQGYRTFHGSLFTAHETVEPSAIAFVLFVYSASYAAMYSELPVGLDLLPLPSWYAFASEVPFVPIMPKSASIFVSAVAGLNLAFENFSSVPNPMSSKHTAAAAIMTTTMWRASCRLRSSRPWDWVQSRL